MAENDHFVYTNHINREAMNWNRRLTRGSSFYRGTRIILNEGLMIQVTNEEGEDPLETPTIKDINVPTPVYWEDDMIKLHELTMIDFRSEFKEVPLVILLQALGMEDSDHMLDDAFDEGLNMHVDLSLRADGEEVRERLVDEVQRIMDSHPNPVLFNNRIGMGYDTLFVLIGDVDEFEAELNEIRAFGEEHDVSFQWI